MNIITLTIDSNTSASFYSYTVEIPVEQQTLTMQSDLTYSSLAECIEALTNLWQRFTSQQ